MKSRMSLVVLGVVCCALAGGCGGGGGGAIASGPPDSRGVLFASIEAKLESFTGDNMDAENQQMLAFLQTKPEFVQTGRTVDGAWGKFADGRRLLVCNNVNAADATRSVSLAASRSPSSRSRRSRADEGGIPITGNVLLSTSFGSFFEPLIVAFPDMFSGQVYTPSGPAATVEVLKSLSDISVLYIWGHGGTIPIGDGGPPEYTVWTSTVRAKDGSTDAPYAADLDDGSMCYFASIAFLKNNDPVKPVKQHAETHYSITHKFVTKYWTGKFSKDSLVFMNTCSGAKPDALNFELACLNAGASAYLGWNQRMKIGQALDSAAFLFDRMLGSNSQEIGSGFKETPPQRAFNIVEVLGEMSTRKRTNADLPLDTTVPPPLKAGDPPVDAQLTLMTLNARFNQLAPSIHDLSVNEQKDELAINGYFGSEMGSVTIGDSHLKIKSWVPETVICELPRTGAGSSGDVIVYNAGGHFSNAAPLTAWHGTAKYTVEELGTLKMVMTFDLGFRGDIHGYRSEPGGQPSEPAMTFNHMLTAKGTYEFSGAYDDPVNRYHEDWSGSGTLKARTDGSNGLPPVSDNTVYYIGSILSGKWDMLLQAVATQGKHVHSFQKTPQGVIFGEHTIVTDGFGLANFQPPGSQFQATVPASFDIPGGKREITFSSPTSKHTLEWSAFGAVDAPTSSTTRSARSGRRR